VSPGAALAFTQDVERYMESLNSLPLLIMISAL
jgi:hypothetical protein